MMLVDAPGWIATSCVLLFLSLHCSITLKEVTEGLEEFNERWRNIEYFSSLPISRACSNHNGDAESLSGDKRGVSQERVNATPPGVRRRHGRISSSAKPGHGRPPHIEGTKGSLSSQDSTLTEWSVGEDSVCSKLPEMEYTSSEYAYLHYSSDGAVTESVKHVIAPQSSLPMHLTSSDDTAGLGWYRSSAPNLRDMPLKLASTSLSAKKLAMTKSNGIDLEDLPPIVEMSPAPSRSNTESQKGNGTSNHVLLSKVGGGSRFVSSSSLT